MAPACVHEVRQRLRRHSSDVLEDVVQAIEMIRSRAIAAVFRDAVQTVGADIGQQVRIEDVDGRRLAETEGKTVVREVEGSRTKLAAPGRRSRTHQFWHAADGG